MEPIWTISFDERALKELKRLDVTVQREIIRYFKERIAVCENPRLFGKGLSSNLSGLWRYRLGKYRVICQIKDNELIILVVSVGHRKNIYL